MKFVRPVARFPFGWGGPCFARLQTRHQLNCRLVEVADFVVFNEHHGRWQGIEQHIEAFIGLKQVSAEVFNFAA